MFDLPAVSVSTTDRSGAGLWLSEAVATFGLVVLIFGLVRAGRAALAPFAVGAYITAAYWWSSLDELRQPDDRRRPHPLRHLRRHRTVVGTMFVLCRSSAARPGSAVVAVLHPDVAATADAVVVPKEFP